MQGSQKNTIPGRIILAVGPMALSLPHSHPSVPTYLSIHPCTLLHPPTRPLHPSKASSTYWSIQPSLSPIRSLPSPCTHSSIHPSTHFSANPPVFPDASLHPSTQVTLSQDIPTFLSPCPFLTLSIQIQPLCAHVRLHLPIHSSLRGFPISAHPHVHLSSIPPSQPHPPHFPPLLYTHPSNLSVAPGRAELGGQGQKGPPPTPTPLGKGYGKVARVPLCIRVAVCAQGGGLGPRALPHPRLLPLAEAVARGHTHASTRPSCTRIPEQGPARGPCVRPTP